MEKIIKLEGNRQAQEIAGLHDGNLKTIEKEFKVKIVLRGEFLKISGAINNIKKADHLIEYLLNSLRSGQSGFAKADLYDLIKWKLLRSKKCAG